MRSLKNTVLCITFILFIFLLTGCSGSSKTKQAEPPADSAAGDTETSSQPSSDKSNTVVYQNDEYGFTFTLPEDWKGYTIVESTWEGLAIDGEAGEKVVQTGPTLSIRDPRWTEAVNRQDIPIMVFTLDQWDSLQKDEFHIGAAPIGPSELGRNNKYVFALPARYNFAFPEGYEEVEDILKGSPLQTVHLP